MFSLAVHQSECEEVVHAECEGNSDAVVIVWNVALLFESLASTFMCVFSSTPYNAAYASERMDSWMMVAFGESVIALLNTRSKFTWANFVVQLGSFVVRQSSPVSFV